MNRFTSLAAVAVLAGGALYFWQSSRAADFVDFVGAAEAQEAEVDTSMVQDMAIGNPEAAVTVVEYASATCPHCKNFHVNAYPEFKANYIDTGKVNFIFREVYFDRFGLWAGMVARCGMPAADTEDTAALEAAHKRYFAIMNMIFQQQSDWLDGDSPAAIAGNLAKIGRTAGLGADEVDACLQDAEMAQAMVAVYQENAAADGVQSTPSFIIDGELFAGDKSYDDFAALVDAALGE